MTLSCLRLQLYRGLRERGWSRRKAWRYATRKPRSLKALADTIASGRRNDP